MILSNYTTKRKKDGKSIAERSEAINKREEIEKIECWMNNYTKKLHNGKSTNEVYFSELNKVG